jgi:glycerate kinase
MPDTVPMITEFVAIIDALPKTAAGEAKVDDATALAVAFIGIAAPAYQVDLDALAAAASSAETVAQQQNDELLGLRAEVDQLRSALASAKGHLEQDNLDEALAVLSVI